MLFGLGVGKGYSAEAGSLVVVVDTSDCGGAVSCGISVSASASPLAGASEYVCCSAETSTAGWVGEATDSGGTCEEWLDAGVAGRVGTMLEVLGMLGTGGCE